MSKKQLYEVEATFHVYAYAVSPDEAIEAVRRGSSEMMLVLDLEDAAMDALPTRSVYPDWLDAFPFGDDQTRTCGEILEAEREARDAAELAAFVDPNQLALPIDVLEARYQRSVDAALQARDLAREDA